jgi:tetratricopeptide (TPR) repeat protein
MTDFREAERDFEIGSQLNQERKYAEALVYFERAASVFRPPALLVNYATALKETGNFEEARRLLQEADDKTPADETEAKSSIAFNMGNNLRESGHQEESIDWFLKAIEIRPGYRGQHFNLGQAYIQLDQFDKAIEQYGYILNHIDSDDAGAKRMREVALMAKEEGISLVEGEKEEPPINLPVYKWRNPEADDLYNECLAMSMKLYGGGLAMEEVGQLYDRLRNNVDQIIQLESDNESSDFWAIACSTYATLAVYQEDNELAEKSIEMGNRSLQLQDGGRRMASSDTCVLYEGLTTAHIRLGRLDEAEDYCMKGLRSHLVRIYYKVSPRLARHIHNDSIEAKLLYWIIIRPLAVIASSWAASRIRRIRNDND